MSLEDLDVREYAQQDPRGFLNQYPDGAILDEVQRTPDIFSYLQNRLDADQKMGRFILTGSQQFGLLSGISQSLAGRVAKISLLPFTLAEVQKAGIAPETLEELLFKGLYPPVYDRSPDPRIWYGNYVETYLERDVRQLVNIRDLGRFQSFLRMCAARTGQILNLSSLANDCGITHNTAKAWISVLEASYIIHLLQPHHKNFNKRLIKAPKLYFHDVGVAAWLLNIQSAAQLSVHPARGQLFETWAVSELLKIRYNQGLTSNLYFWRDSVGNEIDVLMEGGDGLYPVEIKSGQTIAADFFQALDRFRTLGGNDVRQPTLVYGGNAAQKRADIDVLPWTKISAMVST